VAAGTRLAGDGAQAEVQAGAAQLLVARALPHPRQRLAVRFPAPTIRDRSRSNRNGARVCHG
jgi:hypothetical protein